MNKLKDKWKPVGEAIGNAYQMEYVCTHIQKQIKKKGRVM